MVRVERLPRRFGAKGGFNDANPFSGIQRGTLWRDACASPSAKNRRERDRDDGSLLNFEPSTCRWSSNQPNLLNRLGWPGSERRRSFRDSALDWGQRSETDVRDEHVRLGRVESTSGFKHTKSRVGTAAHQNHPGRLLQVELLDRLLLRRPCVPEVQRPGVPGEEGEAGCTARLRPLPMAAHRTPGPLGRSPCSTSSSCRPSESLSGLLRTRAALNAPGQH